MEVVLGMEKNKKGIFNVLDLAKYLNFLHNDLYDRNISPLKLQKVLFFLFGEWGAFIKNSSADNDGKDLVNYSMYLFDSDFEAWVYGPVVIEVYKKFNNETLSEEEIFNSFEKKYVGHFIKDLCKELFELSDFRLVELSHQKKCWKNNYKAEDTFHNKIINKDDIIHEFAGEI